jgi:peptidyl-prolyl cis-trans isomerase B (cyclophilin B)
MSQPRRPSRRVPPKGRSLRSDPRPDPFAETELDAGDEPASTTDTGSRGVRPGSRAANRAAKRAVGGVRPKTQVRGGSGRRSSSSNTPLLLLAIGAIVVVAAVIALGNPFGAPGGSPAPSGDLAVGDGTCPTAQPSSLPASQSRTVTITTPKGNIVLEIDGALSPIAAGNFVALATCHFYDGSVFHRTASLQDGTPFVIQGGEAKAGTGSIPYVIQDEPVTVTYKRGTVAMARTSQPNSQSSQFFIVLDDKAATPLVSANTYAIFGTVISGMDVADAIFTASGGAETPSNPIPMTMVTVGPGPAPSASIAPTAAPTAAPSPAATSPAVSTPPTTAP